MISVVTTLGCTALILAGLLLPGVIWARAARWPLAGLAGGVLSALGLFSGVMVLNGCGVRVTGFTLGGWQAGFAIAGLVYSHRTRPAAAPTKFAPAEWWIALPALPMIAVAVWRAVTQPLPGADVDFRWNYLAEIIVNSGGLTHYPASSAADFTQYFWPDGIAPLVASLYAWTYLAAGSTAKIWTALPVLLQFAGLLTLLLALGRQWGGARGGWFACALGGATMLLQFAFNLGQETGLTALGVGGLAYYLTQWERTRRADLLVPAAACAALAACAREYGLIFPLVGAGWVLVARGGWRPTLGLALGALVLPATWHLRNWLRTGNPFYAQDVAGIFPVNPVFADWMRGYVGIYGPPLRQWSGWVEIGRLIGLTALPASVGLLAGTILWRRQPGGTGTLALAGASVACWLGSVSFTAGGIFYSMRVLSPLLVLGCGWGGAALTRAVSGRRHLTGVMLGLGLFAVDASLRALTIPLNPYAIAPREWRDAGYLYQREFARDDRAFLESVAGQVPGKVLSDSAGVQGLFRAQGRQLVPLWSPDAAFLCSAGFTGDAVTQLLQLGFTHLLLKRAQFSVDFLGRTGAMRRLQGRIHVVRQNPSYVLFALDEKLIPGPGGTP